MLRAHGQILLCLITICLAFIACDDDCSEPDPRGDGNEGDPCVTTSDCSAGLACIGDDFESDALCQPPSELPGGEDPGCIDTPDLWSEHQANGTIPTAPDDDGCELLVFVVGCNCVDNPLNENCLPIQPFYRQETWRRCDGCCWRLVSYWQDDQACEDGEGK